MIVIHYVTTVLPPIDVTELIVSEVLVRLQVKPVKHHPVFTVDICTCTSRPVCRSCCHDHPAQECDPSSDVYHNQKSRAETDPPGCRACLWTLHTASHRHSL
ncbi:hypothetical protein Q5P01_017798 [Channa striata]|uniref:Uncharacterized protein n=1 Tax=Channa striata TaxID=64152 RepID=A0AA88MBI4_CHASR|nr:hypothetical protein Q5P01_017798 [Channa striata]